MAKTSFFKCTRIVSISTPDRDGEHPGAYNAPHTSLSALSWDQDEVWVLNHIWTITFMFFHIVEAKKYGYDRNMIRFHHQQCLDRHWGKIVFRFKHIARLLVAYVRTFSKFFWEGLTSSDLSICSILGFALDLGFAIDSSPKQLESVFKQLINSCSWWTFVLRTPTEFQYFVK